MTDLGQVLRLLFLICTLEQMLSKVSLWIHICRPEAMIVYVNFNAAFHVDELPVDN